MNRLTAIKSIGLSLTSFGVKTEEQNAFLEAWENSKEYTLKVFDQMPEDKFDFKYTPESFSFKTQFVHCITFNATQLSSRLQLKNPFEKVFWGDMNKKESRKKLTDFYEWVAITYKDCDQVTLNKMENFGKDSIPVWRLFYALENHVIHHRGQAICYIRLNGITPVGYVGW